MEASNKRGVQTYLFQDAWTVKKSDHDHKAWNTWEVRVAPLVQPLGIS